jgi:hypothetical protein
MTIRNITPIATTPANSVVRVSLPLFIALSQFEHLVKGGIVPMPVNTKVLAQVIIVSVDPLYPRGRSRGVTKEDEGRQRDADIVNLNEVSVPFIL